MGWMSRLGKSIVGGVQKLGTAVHHGVDAAVRLTDKVAPVVERVASQVARGAAVVGKVAGAAIPFTQEIPVVGEMVDAVAAGAKMVQGAATGVKRGAKFVQGAAHTAQKVERSIERDVNKSVKMGKDFMANPNLHDAVRYRDEVSSMVRHNTANVREASRQFKNIRQLP